MMNVTVTIINREELTCRSTKYQEDVMKSMFNHVGTGVFKVAVS
jgi:hypothetical protein